MLCSVYFKLPALLHRDLPLSVNRLPVTQGQVNEQRASCRNNMLDGMTTHKPGDSIDLCIVILGKLGKNIGSHHTPQINHTVETRPEHQQDNRHQQHWQKLHQSVRAQIPVAGTLGDMPVNN